MTGQPGPIARRWKSLIRLLLQVLAVLALAIGVWTGWILYTAKVQHDAVVVIENAGGWVSYDWELRDRPLVANPKPVWMKWLIDHLDADCFCTVFRVGVNGKESDAVLASVGKLGLIEEVIAQEPSLTDAGLAHLNRLTGLQRLDLARTAITDAGLAHLRGLTNLTYLNLSGTRVTDAGLAHLRGLTRLRTLNLSGTRVTDTGLSSLEPLINLNWLSLEDTQVSKSRARELEKALGHVKTYQ